MSNKDIKQVQSVQWQCRGRGKASIFSLFCRGWDTRGFIWGKRAMRVWTADIWTQRRPLCDPCFFYWWVFVNVCAQTLTRCIIKLSRGWQKQRGQNCSLLTASTISLQKYALHRPALSREGFAEFRDSLLLQSNGESHSSHTFQMSRSCNRKVLELNYLLQEVVLTAAGLRMWYFSLFLEPYSSASHGA